MDEGNNSGKSNTIGGIVDTSKWDRSMWLMKCPALVSRSLKIPSSDNDDDDSTRPVAKVILSIDPLQSNEDSSSSSSSSSTRVLILFFNYTLQQILLCVSVNHFLPLDKHSHMHINSHCVYL